MLFDPGRHEALTPTPWDPTAAQVLIDSIVVASHAQFSRDTYWPTHPRDGERHAGLVHTLYKGANGVMWALNYLHSVGATLHAGFSAAQIQQLRERHHAWHVEVGSEDFASFMMGEVSILLMLHALDARDATNDRLAVLIEGNLNHPSRELMWGSPGTLLIALFLYEHTQQARWADLFRQTARKLWSQLLWSETHSCHYWTQDMYGRQSTYLDGVHGFVATALPLIRGRNLLEADEWAAWQPRLQTTMLRTATWEDGQANWRAVLDSPAGEAPRMLMQFCHGAPGFVICLAGMPGTALDALLLAAGESIWAAGPLVKGANLCHGTAGNGYAFLKLYQRTRDSLWLDRARAFAMHAIGQCEADALQFGQLHFSLWTGDLGVSIYLWHCLQGSADFPTLDVF